MKRILTSLFLMLSLCLTPSWAQTRTSFTTAVPTDDRPRIAEVRLRNGVRLKIKDEKITQRLVASDRGQTFNTDINPLAISIFAAYPSKDNAAVVFARVIPGGMAVPLELLVIYPDNITSFKSYSVQLPKAVKGAVGDNGLLSVTAVSVPIDENEIGDTVRADLRLVPGVGFVNPEKFLQKYAKLGGKFSIDYLSDATLREPLLRAMGTQQFKELRTYMHRSFEVVALEGRWLILPGCHEDGCAGTGVVVIDAEQDITFWAAYDNDEKLQFGGSTSKAISKEYLERFNGIAFTRLSNKGITVELRPNGIPYFKQTFK